MNIPEQTAGHPPKAKSAGIQTSTGRAPALRFPRQAKLLKHSDFQRVYKNGRRHFSGLITAFYLPRNEAAAGPRVGITVSRALGGAVDRNRIKRRIREAVRVHLSQLSPAVDLVLNPKKSVLTASFVQIEQEVKRAFEVVQKQTARGKAKDQEA